MAVGFVIFAIGSLTENDTTLGFGAVVTIVGLIVLYFVSDPWYCQNCGQRLGKAKPKKCNRCQSNRVSKRDPGVGKAVRVKRQR